MPSRYSTFWQWEKMVGADAAERRYWPGRRGKGQWFWLVGGNGHAAVGMVQTGDVAGGRTSGKMLEFERKVKGNGQRYWGSGFRGIESLGWMVERQLSGSYDWESDEGD
jgi:hypothetical protein